MGKGPHKHWYRLEYKGITRYHVVRKWTIENLGLPIHPMTRRPWSWHPRFAKSSSVRGELQSAIVAGWASLCQQPSPSQPGGCPGPRSEGAASASCADGADRGLRRCHADESGGPLLDDIPNNRMPCQSRPWRQELLPLASP